MKKKARKYLFFLSICLAIIFMFQNCGPAHFSYRRPSSSIAESASKISEISNLPFEKFFSGPFASWKSIKTDYGAKGDGFTDDTAAIQRALDDLKLISANSWSTLYFPAGTYRITSTLRTAREAHHDFLGAQIIGEDPQTTTILWDGADRGTMLHWDAWYDKISRITFEGAGKADQGILRAGGFATYGELSDLFFKNFGGGCINLSNGSGGGIAEQYIVRNRFYNCQTGLVLYNYNTLDIYIWNNYFQDCTHGIYTATGAFHAYENRFLRSKTADLRFGSNQLSSIVNNSSVGSKSFIIGDGIPVLYGNTIVNSTEMAMDLSTMGTSFLMDNKVKFESINYPAIQLGSAAFFHENVFDSKQLWPMQPKQTPFDHGKGGSMVVGHGLENSVDEKPETYAVLGMWATSGGGIQWNSPAGTPQIATRYSITSAENVNGGRGLDPTNFILLGSNDWGATWTELDRQTGFLFDSALQKKYFSILTPVAFSTYQLRVLNTVGGGKLNQGGFAGFAEFELLSGTEENLVQRPGSHISGSSESWGSLFTDKLNFQNIPVPTLSPFDVPAALKNQVIIEVHDFSGAAIQKAIDDSMSVTRGMRPLIHLKKGKYLISQSLILPPQFEIQIMGDGASEHGSMLSWVGSAPKPIMILKGPSRVTLKDLGMNGGSGLVIEQADQAGGTILGHQVNLGGGGGSSLALVAAEVEGLLQTQVTFVALGMNAFKYGFRVTGADGDSKQVNILTGASSQGCGLYDVRNKGKLFVSGVWYEGNPTCDGADTMVDLSSKSSGDLTLSSMLFSVIINQPFLRATNFSGHVNILGSQIDHRPSTQLQFAGNAPDASILGVANSFPLADDPNPGKPMDQIISDSTQPSDKLIFLNSLTPNLKNIYAKNFNLPRASTENLSEQLSSFRKIKIPEPSSLPNITNIGLFRITISVSNQQRALLVKAGFY